MTDIIQSSSLHLFQMPLPVNIFLLLFALVVNSDTAPSGIIPELVDESQVNGLEAFLTELEPDLRQLVISILTVYERSPREQIEPRLRDLMQQQPYELLDRLLELYKKAKRKDTISQKQVTTAEQEMHSKYTPDK
ncbi:hypothetical protein PENTCL1PPCAC_26982 [Pristionchus entomophagus]|uniref:SXP/RAL-2 family protein Ani s 5-like cation-binding domain-containing protein n=1 Tax=Pristionchus entomophagus TaxID=358040 RepID=A0AAV5UET2_9BILA|nr:hypothetical protein PENTCL1PPCAC_26982 [Pristionchus entomophagus]